MNFEEWIYVIAGCVFATITLLTILVVIENYELISTIKSIQCINETI